MLLLAQIAGVDGGNPSTAAGGRGSAVVAPATSGICVLYSRAAAFRGSSTILKNRARVAITSPSEEIFSKRPDRTRASSADKAGRQGHCAVLFFPNISMNEKIKAACVRSVGRFAMSYA